MEYPGKGGIMALYTIGEVALLCDINPVTLRAWQRRYGLLKPQRTDGGHRLFNDADIDLIREIKRWIDTGVPVSKVQALLLNESLDGSNGWRDQQEVLLQLLQNGNIPRLRQWLKERTRDYPAETLTLHLLIPLRRRLRCQQPTLLAMLSLLDGILINHISASLAAARKKHNKDALVVGWNIHDTTRLWLEGWRVSEQGWRVEVLANSLNQLRPDLFEGQTMMVWCGDAPTPAQRQQLATWQAAGHAIYPLGI